jgi:hypothetical protein
MWDISGLTAYEAINDSRKGQAESDTGSKSAKMVCLERRNHA